MSRDNIIYWFKNCLTLFLNLVMVSSSLMSFGRLFHRVGATNEKYVHPIVDLMSGMVKSLSFLDLNGLDERG